MNFSHHHTYSMHHQIDTDWVNVGWGAVIWVFLRLDGVEFFFFLKSIHERNDTRRSGAAGVLGCSHVCTNRMKTLSMRGKSNITSFL